MKFSVWLENLKNQTKFCPIIYVHILLVTVTFCFLWCSSIFSISLHLHIAYLKAGSFLLDVLVWHSSLCLFCFHSNCIFFYSIQPDYFITFSLPKTVTGYWINRNNERHNSLFSPNIIMVIK